MQTGYYCRHDGSVIIDVKRFGSLPRSSDSSDMSMTGVNLNIKNGDDFIALFGWYPCILSGSGSLPDVSTIAWDAQPKTGSGVLVPMIESRVISVGDFTDKLDDAEFSAMIESSAPAVRRMWNRLKMHQHVDLDGALITSLMAVLVTALIVTQSRSDEILG